MNKNLITTIIVNNDFYHMGQPDFVVSLEIPKT